MNKKTENSAMDQNAAIKKFKFAVSVQKQKEYDHAIKNYHEAIKLGLTEKLEIEAKNQIAIAYFEISKETFSNFEKVFEAFKDRLINSQFNKQNIPFFKLSAQNIENFREEILNQTTIKSICNTLAKDIHSISKNLKFAESYTQDKLDFFSKIDSFFNPFYEKHKGDDYFIRCIRILSMSAKTRGKDSFHGTLNQIEQFKFEINNLLRIDDRLSNLKKRANDELIFIKYQNFLANKLFGNDIQIDDILKDVIIPSTEQNKPSFELENKKSQDKLEIKKELNFDQALEYFTIGLQNSNEGEYELATENLEKLLNLKEPIIEKLENELELDKPLMEFVNDTLASCYVNTASKIKMGDVEKAFLLYEKCLKTTKIAYDFAFACDGIRVLCNYIYNYKSIDDSEFIILEKLFLILRSKIEEGPNELKTNDFNSLILKLKHVQWKEKLKLYNALADILLDKENEFTNLENSSSLREKVLKELDSITENQFHLGHFNIPLSENEKASGSNPEIKNGKIEDALNKIAVAKKMNSEFLDLSGCGLLELPKSIFELVNLKKLDLSCNSIEEIPEDFSKLVNLVELELNLNQIQKIPESFCNLFKLEYIDLSNNVITEIPESFIKIVGLTKIDLSGNPIEEIISKSEQFLSDNSNKTVSESLSREKDKVFTNTSNGPNDVDGWVSIKNYRHGLYMKEFPPIGNGKNPTVQDVLQNLKKRGIRRLQEESIENFLLSKSTEYVRLGNSKIKPFAEAVAEVEISEENKPVYVTLRPPKPRGRDLEVADVIYELKKKGIDYKINQELIREALELEKYNEPIVIVKEDTSLSNTSLDNPFADLVEVNKPNPTPEEIKKEKITNTITKVQNFANAGNFQNALESINETIDLGLKLPVTFYNRGYVQFQLKNWDEAIQDYSEAIRLNPIDAEYYNARGRTYFELEKLENAIQDFSMAIQIDPEIEMVYLNRGICYSLEREFDKALKDFLEYEKRNTKDPILYLERANIKIEREDIYGAIQDLDRYLKLKPNDFDILYKKALLLFESSNYDEALEICNKILLSQPEWEAAKELRGLLRSKKGDLMGAIHDFGY